MSVPPDHERTSTAAGTLKRMRDVQSAIKAIDAANAEDPNRSAGEPLALRQGRLATAWLARLDDDATPELQLAARAHHLRRWEIARADYPEGRAGYLRWRRDNKRHQAESLAEILTDAGWNESSIRRTRDLLARTALGSDRETQTLEDAACLVFVETQFDEMVDRLDHDHMVSVVAKTLKKMSPAAIELAAFVPMSEPGRVVLAEAVASLAAEEA